MIELEKYFTDILDGKIVACEKIKKMSDKLLNDYHNPGKYHFDYKIAKKHTDFIQLFCKQPSGTLGVPLRLEL